MPELWKYRCPEGHCDWQRRGDGYYCKNCETRYDDLVGRDDDAESVSEVDDNSVELPEPPFAAGKTRDASVYHTQRCGAVKAQQMATRVRSLTENEIRYHELTKCEHCQEVEADD